MESNWGDLNVSMWYSFCNCRWKYVYTFYSGLLWLSDSVCVYIYFTIKSYHQPHTICNLNTIHRWQIETAFTLALIWSIWNELGHTLVVSYGVCLPCLSSNEKLHTENVWSDFANEEYTRREKQNMNWRQANVSIQWNGSPISVKLKYWLHSTCNDQRLLLFI